MTSERDAYRLLGVNPDATPAEVRAAFRKKVMEQHPDTAAAGSDESGVQNLVNAYRVLAPPRPGDSVENATQRSGTGSRRIRVEHLRGAEPVDPRDFVRRCPACGGTGRRTQSIRCRDCGGSGRVTILEMKGARVSSCPTCRGRGQRRVAVRCHVCDASGAD